MNRQAFADYQRLTTDAFRNPDLSILERAKMLRDAATLAMPPVCRGEACESDARACSSRHPLLSDWDRRDCLQRLWAESNACKQEALAAIKAGSIEGFRSGLQKWVDAENSSATAAALDPSPPRVSHWHYLAYWRCITAAQIALHEADFPLARRAFAEGQQHARHFDASLHPFYGSKELAAEDIYIDAVVSVKDGLFSKAAELFEKWLALFPERRGIHDLRFDSVRANYLACMIIDETLTDKDSSESLVSLARHLRTTNVLLPTWTLYRRVQKIAAAAHLFPSNVRSLVDEDCMLWTLFLPYTKLDEADKKSGQARTFVLPRFLDLSGLSSDHEGWLQILNQSLRNALYILVDYERFRHDVPPDNEKGLRILTPPPSISDDLYSGELLRIVRKYIERRDPKLLPAYDQASTLLTEFSGDRLANRFPEALETYQRILECFRFPHTVLVEEVEAKDRPSKSRTGYNVTVRRLWNREPRVMDVQTLEPLDKGEYYYLRPTWNTQLGVQYPLNRGDRIGPARAARWVDAFWRGMFLPHKVDATIFTQWILQFAPSERRFASLLFDALDIYDDERVRNEWIKAYQQLPLTAKRDAAFIGLGHPAKSGHAQVYYFRQGIAKLPEYQTLYGGREKTFFRDMSEFANNVLRRPSTFVFIDDFVGTGSQASDFFGWYFQREELRFLKDSDVFLMVLSGFGVAIKAVEKVLRSEVGSSNAVGVVAARVLNEDNRAFAGTSRIWRDALEASRAQEWAAEVGHELLVTDPTRDGNGQPLYDPGRDALGWHGCQGLISFHYNIPSDTLPIFWSRGSRRGKTWVPLQHRSD